MSRHPSLPPIQPALGPTGFGPLASRPGARDQTAPTPPADTMASPEMASPEIEASGQTPSPLGEPPRSVAVVQRGVRPPAGHAVLGRATGLRRVGPVTRRARPAGSSRVRSTARDDGRRTLRFDSDAADTAINGPRGHPPAGHVSPVRFTAVDRTPIRRRADA